MCNNLLKLCIVILLFSLEFAYARKNECPGQLSNVASDGKKVIWKSSGIDNEIVISVPPCEDADQKLLTRICANGSWFPNERPTCTKIIEKHRRCPRNTAEVSKKCIFVSEPKVWEEQCQPVGKNRNLTSDNELIWLPVTRKVRYGPYESVTWGEDFGYPIDKFHEISYEKSDIFNKDCLVVNSGKQEILPVDCTEKHTFVCPFNYDDDDDEDDNDCPHGCINAGLIKQKCFCKKKRCRNLAQIHSIEDKHKLSKLVDNENCYIGDPVDTGFKKFGFRQAINKDSWFFTQKNLSCSLCLETSEKSLSNVKMILEFDDKREHLILIVYSSDNLHKSGYEDYVYCFTDASKLLKKRVKVKEVHVTYEKSTRITFYKLKLEKYIGHYWCEAFTKEMEEPVYSNKLLAYSLKNGNEYSLRLLINDACSLFSCSTTGGTLDYTNMVDDDNLSPLKHNVAEIRVMEVFDFDFQSLDILLHLTTKKSYTIIEEFVELTNIIRSLHENIEIIFFRNSEYCLPETTRDSMFWPETKIGEVTVPANPCITADGLPLTRICEGDFMYGSEWSHLQGQCNKNMSDSTRYMYSIFQKNVTNAYISDIEKFTENEDLTVLGQYYLTKVLRKISNYDFPTSETHEVFQKTFKITNNLMKMSAEVLSQAEKYLNVTDEIIDALEDFTAKWNESEDFLLVNENVILHIANPFATNTTGMLLYKRENEFIVENFKSDYTYEKLEDKEHLQFACYAPESLLNEFPLDVVDDIRVISTIFLKPHFFPEDAESITGPIVSIIIQGLDSYLPSPIPVWFRASDDQENPTCAFWDYGKKTLRHKGNWSKTGGKYMGRISNSSSMHICTFSHLTHFALLAANAKVIPNSIDEKILDAFTIIGDMLSLIGIAGIISTAIMFKNWRRKPGTKILLNLSVAISVEIVGVFLIQMKVLNSNPHCRVVGPILHYIILCKHFWMLVYAFLQYNRFVKVLAAIPNNIVLKSVIFGWGFSSIPVLIVFCIDPNTYSITNHNFCYPKDLFLYLGVFLPIFLIITLNTIVFFIVMRNISSTMSDPYLQKIDSRTQKLQLKLAALLFFVLGLPIFIGLTSNLIEIEWLQITMIYIFSLTSNIQGFILFLFYVILNKETRQQWLNYITKTIDKSSAGTTSTRYRSSKS